MKKAAICLLLLVSIVIVTSCASTPPEAKDYRRMPVDEYVDRMKAGWIGQMAGVGWGGPTEFRWKGAIIPEDKMPKWKPEMINQFNQDDIYVEMTFLPTRNRSIRTVCGSSPNPVVVRIAKGTSTPSSTAPTS